MYAIETHNLTKKYGEKVVVNHVNLKVKRDRYLVFLARMVRVNRHLLT